MNILPIGLAAGAIALLLSFSKKSSAASKSGSGVSEIKNGVSNGASSAGASAAKATGSGGSSSDAAAIEAARKIIAKAPEILGRGNPDEIEAAASKIAPWEPDVANDWRAFAKLIRESKGQKPEVVNIPKKSTPKSTPSPEPKSIAVPETESVSSQSRAIASKFALMLQSTKSGKEDKSVIKLFQTDNGLNPDGYYGRQTGIMLARKYGIVPPRPPVSWGTSKGGYASVAPDKQLYRQAMIDLAKTDSARADEWTAAAAAVK